MKLIGMGRGTVVGWMLVISIRSERTSAFVIPISSHKAIAIAQLLPFSDALPPCHVTRVREGPNSVEEVVGGSLRTKDEGRISLLDCEPPIPSSAVKVGWMERLRQLDDFQQHFGHTIVPKRYKANPALGNWVNKQRQQYRNYLTGAKPCSLTDSRIDLLNQINFCWDSKTTTGEVSEKIEQQQWWSRLEELRSRYRDEKNGVQSTSLVNVPRQTRLGVWLDGQRKAYFETKCALKTNCTSITEQRGQLSEAQIFALAEIDPDWWMTRQQWRWESRFRELQGYAASHGDCCVRISYADNTQLANWVSTQRKQYNLRVAGKPSTLTDDRLQRLEAINFVWNRWEYEFNNKEGDRTS